MRLALNLTLIGLIAVLVVLIPFALFGDGLGDDVERILSSKIGMVATVLVGTGFLIADVLLPIPSSIVSAFLTSTQGWLVGGAAVWVGNAAGSVLGYLIGSSLGAPIVARLVRPVDVERSRSLVQHFGPWAVFVARGVPVLAEATTLLAGSLRMPWPSFAIASVSSSLLLAMAYAWFARAAVDLGANATVAFLAAMICPAVLAIGLQFAIKLKTRTNSAIG